MTKLLKNPQVRVGAAQSQRMVSEYAVKRFASRIKLIQVRGLDLSLIFLSFWTMNNLKESILLKIISFSSKTDSLFCIEKSQWLGKKSPLPVNSSMKVAIVYHDDLFPAQI